ncbi:MAG: hypothetical protein WBL40_22850 [Terrimicrobiaceae bacterium]
MIRKPRARILTVGCALDERGDRARGDHEHDEQDRDLDRREEGGGIALADRQRPAELLLCEGAEDQADRAGATGKCQ